MHMQVIRIIVGIYLIRLELSFLYLSIGTTFTTNNNETNNTALILQNTVHTRFIHIIFETIHKQYTIQKECHTTESSVIVSNITHTPFKRYMRKILNQTLLQYVQFKQDSVLPCIFSFKNSFLGFLGNHLFELIYRPIF